MCQTHPYIYTHTRTEIPATTTVVRVGYLAVEVAPTAADNKYTVLLNIENWRIIMQRITSSVQVAVNSCLVVYI